MNMSQIGVLVKLSISQFSNSRQDDTITNGVKALHKLSGKAGRWVKYKLPEESLKEISSAASAARAAHYELSLPWEDGKQLLTSAALGRYGIEMAKAEAVFWSAVDAFVENYDGWLDQARLMHGKTFNAQDYPLKSHVRGEFRFKLTHYPIPESTHFGGTMRDMFSAALAEENQARVNAAIAEVAARLLEPVSKMAERLANDENVFRDTLVENIKDIVDRSAMLNITNDPQIAAMRSEINAAFGKLSADTLRVNKAVRRDTQQAATAIIRKFGSLGEGRRFVA